MTRLAAHERIPMIDRQGRITAFVGNYGSGKTEIALSTAYDLRAAGESEVMLVDLDIVNPYFRSSTQRAQLLSEGIEVEQPSFALTTVDIPALPASILRIFERPKLQVIIDVGGNEVGAAALGQYRPYLEREGCDLLYVINTFRPLSSNADDIIEMMAEIQGRARVAITGIVNNSNLQAQTSPQDIIQGHAVISEVAARTHIPIRGIGALPGLMRCVAGRSAGGNSLMALLLITVSAAMVAAGGELGALLVNVHGAREMGMALTAVLAGVCVACGMAALKWLGGATVIMMLGYFVVLALRAPEPGPVYVRPGALASAAAYAGFNLTGACGVACAAGLELGSRGDARRAAISVGRATGLLLLALLLAALVCMRVHWAQVESAPMPSVLLAAGLGIAGYYMTIVVMWIAVLSTLAGALLALELQARRWGFCACDVRVGVLGAATLLGGIGALYLAVLLVLGRREWMSSRR